MKLVVIGNESSNILSMDDGSVTQEPRQDFDDAKEGHYKSVIEEVNAAELNDSYSQVFFLTRKLGVCIVMVSNCSQCAISLTKNLSHPLFNADVPNEKHAAALLKHLFP